MHFWTPRILLGRPDVALAPSRILPCACTTRYGDAPDDDDILAQVPESFGTRPEWLPWFPASQQDTPAGTVWNAFVCVPLDSSSRRNLVSGCGLPKTRFEILLPEGLWAYTLLSRGKGALRVLRSPSGLWFSRWNEGQARSLEGPFPADAVPSRWTCESGEQEHPDWSEPEAEALARLADDYPEAQLLPPIEAARRRERLATTTTLARVGAVALAGLFVVLATQVPVWVAGRGLHATEVRLASVRPDIDRLDRLRASVRRDAAYLAASSGALRPAASPLPLLEGLARRLPEGGRLLNFQLESPPGEPGWKLRTDIRLPDWDGVPALVDSSRLVPSVRDVKVESQQRDKDRVHLVLSLEGDWP